MQPMGSIPQVGFEKYERHPDEDFETATVHNPIGQMSVTAFHCVADGLL